MYAERARGRDNNHLGWDRRLPSYCFPTTWPLLPSQGSAPLTLSGYRGHFPLWKTWFVPFWLSWCTKTLRVSGDLIRWVWEARYWASICPISHFIGCNCLFSFLEVEVRFATCPISQKTIRFEISMDLLSLNGRTMHSFSVAEGYWSISTALDGRVPHGWNPAIQSKQAPVGTLSQNRLSIF